MISRPQRSVILCANTAWNLVNFRRGLIQAFLDKGYDVVAVAPPDEFSDQLTALGCQFYPIALSPRGISPLEDIRLLRSLFKIIREVNPLIFCGFTIKPNVYGSLAAHFLRVPVINNIAGRGTAFGSSGLLLTLIFFLYRISLGRARHVFFQNQADQDYFVQHGLVATARTSVLPGSGVDLARFAFSPICAESAEAPPLFLLHGRLLVEKGVAEFIAAARDIKATHDRVRFQLLGFIGDTREGYIDRTVLDKWCAEGIVEYLGVSSDVRPFIESSTCVVLPSFYNEGTPRSLLEAAAIGRPVITTDTPGCRDVVEDGVSGFLVVPKDSESLRLRMLDILRMSRDECIAMGKAARERMERLFDERIIQERYLEQIEAVVAAN